MTNLDRDALRLIFVENGLEAGGSLHGWRCEHADVYGACDCLDELIGEVMHWAETDRG